MKVALVCDDLIQHGGHENVVLEFTKMFPSAPLYTTLASRKWQKVCSERKIRLRTSFLNKLPFVTKLNRILAAKGVHAVLLESYSFDDFDLVISISARFAHGVITKPQTTHISYISTVGRMFWEPDIYFENETLGFPRFIEKAGLWFLRFFFSYIRVWDRGASQRPDFIISNSKITQARIKKYYGRDSELIHPPVELDDFAVESDKEDYYLVLTRLVSWKRVGLAIKACKKLGVRLKIVGAGSDEKRLRKLAGGDDKIEFLGYLTSKQKSAVLAKAKAVINTQFEDFGIVPVEAMASGTPVIAYKKGGVLETVTDKTGVFFDEQTSESLVNAIQAFENKNFEISDLTEQALKFSANTFSEKIQKFVEQKMPQHKM